MNCNLSYEVRRSERKEINYYRARNQGLHRFNFLLTFTTFGTKHMAFIFFRQFTLRTAKKENSGIFYNKIISLRIF